MPCAVEIILNQSVLLIYDGLRRLLLRRDNTIKKGDYINTYKRIMALCRKYL